MAPTGNRKLMASSKAQGATEYLLILGVLGLIAVVAASLLGYLPGSAGDAKKETYAAQLRAGEPFSIEAHKGSGGKLTLSFANKKSNELELTHILLGAEDIDLEQSTGGLSKFSGGMRRVIVVDVPCVDGEKEFEVTLAYTEDGVQKEEKLNGKVVVEDCVEGSDSEPGGECSVDEDCAQGSCIAGVCEISVGVCYSDEECESGNCNPYTNFCDPRPEGTCSPSCMLEDASIVCGETIAGAECSGWEDANPQCGVLPDCGGEYSECSLVCGGVCAGWNEECGGGAPCCSGFVCNGEFCVQEEGGSETCGGTYAACNASTCCDGIYCSQAVDGACQMCKTSGACNATQCCEGYVCGVGYLSPDVPRGQNECSLPDGSECSQSSQCFNGTCYDGACKNCNTNNACNPANGNADCCYGKLCLMNQSGNYTCASAVNASGSYEYLYDVTWQMNGEDAVIYKVYSNGTSVPTYEFAGPIGEVCSRNEECLSNSCVGGVCIAQTEGSWCDCVPGEGYASCVCPTQGNICDPYNYTCVSVLGAPVGSYGYLCGNSSVCYQQCYNDASNFYSYCNYVFNVCRKGGEPCLVGPEGNAQCCSNNCTNAICTAQVSGSTCQVYTYSPEWPFGNATPVEDKCGYPLCCFWNTTTTPYCFPCT